MATRNTTDKGRPVHLNEGLGQQRVGEAGAAPDQKSPRPPPAGGPGTGAGDDAETNTESDRRA